MAIGNNIHGDNTPNNPLIGNDAKNVEVSIDDIARKNVEMFKKIALLECPDLIKDSGIQRAIIDKAMKDRVVDMSYAGNLMKSIKLNLTSNGALLFSLNDGKQLYNHPVTKNERAMLDKIMNNPNLSDDMKFERLNNILTGMSMNIKLSNNFEQTYQQSQNMTSSLQR